MSLLGEGDQYARASDTQIFTLPLLKHYENAG